MSSDSLLVVEKGVEVVDKVVDKNLILVGKIGEIVRKVVGSGVGSFGGIVGRMFGSRVRAVRIYTFGLFGGKVLQDDFHVRLCSVYPCFSWGAGEICTFST